MGNHTFDHVDLTKVSDDKVIQQLQKNHDFLFDTFGVDSRPYYRPPYGHRDERTDGLAASIGYTAPVLWTNSIYDSKLLDPAKIVALAKKCFLPGQIVIGHLNHDPVTEAFPELLEIIQSRALQTVTLDDVFLAS
ncbi:polysaccharide deacetylase family protein [Subtercola boreus]|uniref:polysaccharide deacetylase family protein n=1 Tax=Subtercola boreus TaxID=120213 RepID=UPI00209BEEAC|nr:polysaccharide deacetylase family protein [Subtercola boreus]